MTDIWELCRGHPGYPAALEDLDAVDGQRSPERLYGCGDRALVTGLDPAGAVTIVGARRCTAYGRETATELAGSLAAAGIVVVSGMAYGIDSAAHRGALDAGGTTIAVLACGPERAYPPSARALYRRIAGGGGAIVSEAAPGYAPKKWDFPRRNRIMAALARMTIVVEARQASGSRHTADHALALNREVGAVPGPVRSPLSAGPHGLLDDGAVLVTGAQDVLDRMLGTGVASARRVGPALEGDAASLLGVLADGSLSLAGAGQAAGLDPSRAAIALARLELLGYVRQDSGRYARTGLTPPG